MDAQLNTPPAGPLPSRKIRLLVSVLVLLHVAAVFLGPFSMAPSSELAGSMASVFRPYIEAMNLANGYRFFAPEPGPSHLIRYELTRDDGTRVEGAFPDRALFWPRLRYHRYFMLSEFINTLENPGTPKEIGEAYAQSYAQHLLDEHHATSAKLYLKRHFVPRTNEVRQGMKLSDKQLYTERPLVVFQPDE